MWLGVTFGKVQYFNKGVRIQALSDWWIQPDSCRDLDKVPYSVSFIDWVCSWKSYGVIEFFANPMLLMSIFDWGCKFHTKWVLNKTSMLLHLHSKQRQKTKDLTFAQCIHQPMEDHITLNFFWTTLVIAIDCRYYLWFNFCKPCLNAKTFSWN